MLLKPNYVPPPGRYEYKTNDVVLWGETESILYDKVVQFRVQNMLTPCDRPSVIREINDYYCAKHPHYCNPEPGEFDRIPEGGPNNMRLETPLVDAAIEWLDYWMDRMLDKPNHAYLRVTKKEAEDRAHVCANCIANQLGVTNCPTCTAQLTSRALAVVANAQTDETPRLGICKVRCHHLVAAVQMQASDLRLTEEVKARLPKNCWEKNL